MWRMIPVLLLALGFLGGCKGPASQGNLDGYWAITSEKASSMSMTMGFTPPDKVNAVMTNGGSKYIFNGTYKLDGDTFTSQMSDVSLEASGPNAAADKLGFQLIKDKLLKDFNGDPVGTIKWEDKDKFTITWKDDGHVTTFTRTVGPDLTKALHGPG